MKVKFKLKMFNQEIPITLDVPNDVIEKYKELENNSHIAINEALNDELDDVMIDTWEPL